MMVKSIIVVEAKHSEPSVIFGDWILIEVKLEQQLKHFSPKLVTDDGIVTKVKFPHPRKQLSPNLVTDDGMVIDFTQSIYYWLIISIIRSKR